MPRKKGKKSRSGLGGVFSPKRPLTSRVGWGATKRQIKTATKNPSRGTGKPARRGVGRAGVVRRQPSAMQKKSKKKGLRKGPSRKTPASRKTGQGRTLVRTSRFGRGKGFISRKVPTSRQSQGRRGSKVGGGKRTSTRRATRN